MRTTDRGYAAGRLTCRSVLQTSLPSAGASSGGRCLDSFELTRVWHHEGCLRVAAVTATRVPDRMHVVNGIRVGHILAAFPTVHLSKNADPSVSAEDLRKPEEHPSVGIGPDPPARSAGCSGIADSNDSQGPVNDLGGLFGRFRQNAAPSTRGPSARHVPAAHPTPPDRPESSRGAERQPGCGRLGWNVRRFYQVLGTRSNRHDRA